LFAFHSRAHAALQTYAEKVREAIHNEMQQLHHKGVFEPISEMPLGHRVIPCSYFVKEKYNGDGHLIKLKGRCVAGGHRQIRSTSTSTSSPTVSITSLFLVITIAAHENWDVVTLDLTGAYLNAPLNDGVFMRLYPYPQT
jgi:hypothetical protein